MKTQAFFIDLTERPPRSFRVRLGGFVILARMIDKGRATLSKKNGEYIYNSPTDQHLVRFLGFDAEALLNELAAGKGDGEILQWVLANAKTPRAPREIEAWSAFMEKRGPDSDAETLALFAEYVGQHSQTREDIKTWFEAAEFDDCQLWRKAVNPARQHESSLKSPLAARVSKKRGLSHGTCRSRPHQSQITKH